MHEFALIQKYFANFPGSDFLLEGVGDDAAVIKPPADHLLVQSSDTLVSGVHFPEDAPADDVAYKALMVNLSDIAAMGAKPLWFTLALTLPEINEAWLQSFSKMLRKLSEEKGVVLVGGDTTAGEQLSLNITITGAVEEGRQVMRSGASVGDAVFVSGHIGDGALGLALWQGRIKSVLNAEPCLDKFYRPVARTELGMALGPHVSAMIDCSDGLFADLGHILNRSECGAELMLDSIPVSESLSSYAQDIETLTTLLNGGDDYELIMCAPASEENAIQKIASQCDCPVTRIGTITSESGLRVLDHQGKELTLFESGYKHFG